MTDSVFGENKSILEKKKASLKSLSEWLYQSAAQVFIAKNGSTGSPDELSEYYSSAFGGELFSDDFAMLCREYSRECSGKIHPFPSYDETENEDLPSKIAYVKNPYSDNAYKVFAEQIDNASAQYFPSFREACEDVYYLRSKYAILPLYTSCDGYLSPFRRLMIKYDLKIEYTAECDTDGETVTRFALLRKGLPHFNKEDNRRSVLLSIIPSGEQKFFDIISSLSALGAETEAVSTQSSEYSAAESCFDIVLNIDRDRYSALYLFLEGTHIRYNIVGNYILLK